MSSRIKWVDIYKGLAILLVVVGHATGLFNPYIYQFHMAAFFFISGYTSKLKEKGLLQTWLAKGYSIYVPYVSFFLMTLFFVWLLHRMGYYSILFRDPYPGVVFSLKEFFDHRIYINILGATWFLMTLYGIYVLQRFILLLCYDHPGLIYGLISLAIYFTGYGIIRASIFIPDGFWYLVFIGQFYFSLGYLASQKGWLSRISSSKRSQLLLLTVTVIFLYLFAHHWPNTVDYPSRHFGNALGNFLAAGNGILFLFIVSLIIEGAAPARVTSCIIRVGQNTLGIVFLHFLYFKASYWLLALLGQGDMDYVSAFTPPLDIGRSYWWLISGLSVALSVMTWTIFLRMSLARILMGQDKEILPRFFGGYGRLLARIDVAVEEELGRFRLLLCSMVHLAMGKYKVIVVLLAVLLSLAVLPMLMQGIVCNDELQTSYWAQLGWGPLWDHYVKVWASQGRVLGAPLNIVAVYIGFLSTNGLIFRAISIGLMLAVFGLLGWLVARLLKNKTIGFVVFVALILLLPISFEHTLPNSFVALFSFPLILAFISFHLFLSYLKDGRRILLVASSLLWLLFLTGYEAFVTLTPIFFIIAYIVRAESPKNVWRIVVECRHIIATSTLFLLAYVIARHFFPSIYSGNSIAKFNLGKSASVIGHLVASGVPGYYLFNAKYQYLFDIFQGTFQSMGAVLHASPLATLAAKLFPFDFAKFSNFRNAFAEPRMLIMSTLGLTAAWKVGFRINADERMITKSQLPGLLGIPVLMSILLAIPNSLGELYQETANATNFIALPVTFLIYGFMVFVLVIVVCFALERMSSAWARAVLMGLVMLLVLPVQAMNGIFSQEQERNFNRLTMLQAVFDTELLHHLDGDSIFTPDFYETKNSMGIHDGYWTTYAKSKGLNLELSSKYSGQSYELRVLSDSQVVLVSREKAVLLSLERVDNQGFYLIHPLTHFSSITSLANGIRDGIFFKYTTPVSSISSTPNDGFLLTVLGQNDRQFLVEARISSIGSSFDKAQNLVGFFRDGWVASEAALSIRTGMTGKITLSGMLTIPKKDDMMIEVFDNDRRIGQYKVTQERFQIDVPVNSGGMVANLKFKANWEFDAARPDVRRLSYLLVSLTGE